ncbi:hypothetical protein [Collinsella tanakaei]|uniref:hypothetical protein n=1 Tax=Collinsella tanakaei TaxID=626935 RepID=UPI0025A394B0|nr:hypothetical protein [Collinsella tanakaei]MDM8302444.1 hypothetical protein [Collinsella tanakaei]
MAKADKQTDASIEQVSQADADSAAKTEVKSTATTNRRAVDRDILHNLPGTKAMFVVIVAAIIAYVLSRVGAYFDIDVLFRGGTMVCFSLLIMGGLMYFHSYGIAKKLTRERREQEEQQ